MQIKFLKRSFFQRILGIPATAKPAETDSWQYADGLLTINLSKTPELTREGGALRFEGGNLPKRVLVISDDTKNYHAFHNRCTHVGHRRLDPVPGTGTVQCCSVGKSTYDLSGKNIFGPAPDSIETFKVKQKEETLTVEVG